LRTSYRIPAVGTGQNKKRRQRPASTPCQGFHAHKAAPFLPAEKCPNSTSYRAKKANAACSMSRPIAPKPHLRLWSGSIVLRSPPKDLFHFLL